MRSRKLPTTVVSLALLALAIAGCGGGGEETTESAPTTVETTALTKAELISQGDAICGEVNAAIGALGAAEAEVGDSTVKTADLYIGMVESIKGLGTPEETEGYAEFIAAAEDLSAVQAEAKLASEREDGAAIGAATTEAGPILEDFSDAAGEYGFEECSEGPSAPAPTGAGSGVAPEEEAEGGLEVAPEELEEEAPIEEVVPEEVAPETGGAGGGVGEAAPEAETGGSSGGVGPG
jgi:hypothetical protein